MTLRRMLISTLCVALSAAAARAADWPCYLGPNRNNTSAEKDLRLWSGDSPKIAGRRTWARGIPA